MTDKNNKYSPSNPVYDLSMKTLGRGSYLNTTTGTATTTHTAIIRHNPNRVAYTFINNSDSVLYIAPTPDVSATKGIPLEANGGGVTMVYNEHGEAVTNPWYGIVTAGSKPWTLIETIIEGG